MLLESFVRLFIWALPPSHWPASCASLMPWLPACSPGAQLQAPACSAAWLQVAAQCAAARGSCVSLMAGQCSGGQTVVAASKAGRVTMLDGAGREVSTLQLLDKNHGAGLCMQVLSPFHCLCVSSPMQAVLKLAAFLPASLSLQAS